MAIRKQEFYEGAALHVLARGGFVQTVHYDAPLFLFNRRLRVLIKYSTRGRSPWGFTFSADELSLLRKRSDHGSLVVALVCGADGIAVLSYDALTAISPVADEPQFHVSCSRGHGKHYSVKGPVGRMERKVAPSAWQRILNPQPNE
jgi:hypothetical protein